LKVRSPKRAVVVGAGRVGALIARDLARDPDFVVRAVDRDPAALASLMGAGPHPIETRVLDPGRSTELAECLADADVVVGAVPGAHGFETLRRAIQAGRPVVDISFMPEDPGRLDEEARLHGATVVVDCGVAPGISNWLVGRSCVELDEVDSVEIYVGGLPVQRRWPYEYAAVFSPADVIEEYTRPCRMRENGVDVVVPALSGVERVEVEEVGTLEAFYTDGLRTLLRTVPARTLREKTLRYPGHAEKMLFLREGGFFDREPVLLEDGRHVPPRLVSETLLFRSWSRAPGELEFTVLRVVVHGRSRSQQQRIVWDLFDRTDPATGDSSMARTTGFPCAIVARMLARSAWSHPGVHAPESLGRDAALTERLLAELAERGVRIRRQGA
jgi:saccharopine dehydrogenase-like NADP-dependent oxidoreductase